MDSVSEEDEESDEDPAESPMGDPSSSASTCREHEGFKPPPKPRPPRRGSKPGPETTRSSSSLDSPTKPTPPSRTDSNTEVSASDRPWASLAQDQQFYLDYHRSSLTYCHYLLKHDHGNFIHSTLLEAALQFKPLLYAVLGFAAFHHTVHKPGGKLTDFLTYYNKSVSLLRQTLQEGQPHTEAMLMTILQLATFEVCRVSGLRTSLLTHCRNTLATGPTSSATNEPPTRCFSSCSIQRPSPQRTRVELS